MRRAAAVVLVAVAALVLALSARLTYGLAELYSADVVRGGGWVPLALLSAGLVLLCLLGAGGLVRAGPRAWVLTVGVLVVCAATVWSAAAYGGRAHDRDREARTAACSPEDVALLTAVEAPGAGTEPSGDADGGCSVLVPSVPDAVQATAEVVSSLERGGWRQAGRDGDALVLRRGSAVLRLSASSDGKVTDIRLTLPPASP